MAAFTDGDRASPLAGCVLVTELLPAEDYPAVAERLCGLDEHALAERLISGAHCRFPDNTGIAVARARVAMLAGDFTLAAHRYRDVRLARPQVAQAYLGEANSLSDAGRLDEAAAVLDEAVMRFPRDLGIAITQATVVQKRGPAREAILCWTRLNERFPQWSGGYLAAAKLHRGMGEFDLAESLLTRAMEIFPSDFGVLTERAWLARIRGDLPEAWTRWRQTCLAFPDLDVAYIHEAQIDFELGRPDDAEALLHETVARFPGNANLFAHWASLAEKRGRWTDADDRWRQMRERFPENVAGYANGVHALRKLERSKEAAELARVAAGIFPEHKGLRDEILQLELEQVERTKVGFATTIEQFPDSPVGYIGLIEILIDLKQFGKASTVAADARARFPDRINVYTLGARAAEAAGDLQGASVIWRETKDKFPSDHEPYRQYRRLLVAIGDFVAAEIHSQETCERFSQHLWAFRDHADLAGTRRDWAEATRRWTDVGTRFGENVSWRLHDLRIQQLDHEVELAQQAGGDLSALLNYHSDAGRPSDEDEQRTVMMTFESLGGIVTGCEFGAVQRAFGAEPLGLLRWTGMSMDTLIDMLERRFKDIGNRATTEIGYYDLGERREYSVRDKTFGFIGHTHVYDNEMDEKTIFDQVTKRMSFLTRKLLDDLTRREKIFLFKNTIREPYPEEIERLHLAMRSYGGNLLLLVTATNEQNPNTTLKVLHDNLWLGYMDFNGEYGGERAQRWLELCRLAYANFKVTL